MMADDNDSSDDLLFTDDDSDADIKADGLKAGKEITPWKLLIVDDDSEVHAITRVVLNDVVFDDRPLLFLSAYSAREARAMVAAHEDLAAILLDVVMESDDAGLRLVETIRNEIGNKHVRIILRTGQPGQAPERQVIVNYDINDYKAKSELTAQKLFTTTIAALRSYQHISAIERNRRGLEKILDTSASLFEMRSLKRFIEGVLLQVTSFVTNSSGSLLCTTQSSDHHDGGDAELEIIAGSGVFEGRTGQPVRTCVSAPVYETIRKAFAEHRNFYLDDQSAIIFQCRTHASTVVYVTGHAQLNDLDQRLIEIFCSRVAVGFDNVYLYEQLNNAQKATVYALGKMAEYKDEVTGDHVRRVERLSAALAHRLRTAGQFPGLLDDIFCDQIGLASILHDVGKVGIPDSILRKPGRLDNNEMVVMRSHAEIGGTILREAARMVDGRSYLTLGAEIAESHHEKFDGTGYPTGIDGEHIPVAGRIVAVADVFDALTHSRPYKAAWSTDDAMEMIRKESGRHFDPRVVTALDTIIAECRLRDMSVDDVVNEVAAPSATAD